MTLGWVMSWMDRRRVYVGFGEFRMKFYGRKLKRPKFLERKVGSVS